MVTLVSAEIVQEVEAEPAIREAETMQWHYHVPCAGVRYYSYGPIQSPAEEPDPWSLQGVAPVSLEEFAATE